MTTAVLISTGVELADLSEPTGSPTKLTNRSGTPPLPPAKRRRRTPPTRPLPPIPQYRCLSQNRAFSDSHYSPPPEPQAGVQNPYPKSTSHNPAGHRLLRPSAAWTPTWLGLRPTDQQLHLQASASCGRCYRVVTEKPAVAAATACPCATPGRASAPDILVPEPDGLTNDSRIELIGLADVGDSTTGPRGGLGRAQAGRHLERTRFRGGCLLRSAHRGLVPDVDEVRESSWSIRSANRHNR
jgi:hypothetical protein